MITEIVDALYEAAFISEKWPAVLTQITDATASKGGVIIVFADGMPVRGRAIPSQQTLMNEIITDETFRLYPATALGRLSSVRLASFVDLDSFLTAEEIRDDPARSRMRAHGLGA